MAGEKALWELKADESSLRGVACDASFGGHILGVSDGFTNS